MSPILPQNLKKSRKNSRDFTKKLTFAGFGLLACAKKCTKNKPGYRCPPIIALEKYSRGKKTQTQGMFRKNSSNSFVKTQQIGNFNSRIVKKNLEPLPRTPHIFLEKLKQNFPKTFRNRKVYLPPLPPKRLKNRWFRHTFKTFFCLAVSCK